MCIRFWIGQILQGLVCDVVCICITGASHLSVAVTVGLVQNLHVFRMDTNP